jgi:glycosyltransferase involved in cell wall biosynthesis
VLYGGIAARLTGVPASVGALTGLGHVFVAAGPKARALRSVVARVMRFALGHPNGAIIFQNPDDQRILVERGIVPPDAAVLIRGSGVDLEQYAPAPEPDGPVLVVLASRMLWSKGVGEFVDAAQRLRRDGVHARFALVGGTDPGNPAAVPADTLTRWRDSGVLEWWGRKDDMPGVFASSHVVCLPSYYGEGVPKVLIEAAACGRPIVTTDAPGCREVVREGDNGLLVPMRDSEALAAALRRLIGSAQLRRVMGSRSREIAVAEFSVEHVIEATLALYERLLAPRGVQTNRVQGMVI